MKNKEHGKTLEDRLFPKVQTLTILTGVLFLLTWFLFLKMIMNTSNRFGEIQQELRANYAELRKVKDEIKKYHGEASLPSPCRLRTRVTQ